MKWERIAGQESLKKQLQETVSQNRVSHAQLFLGKDGYGTLPLALAYASEILQHENPAAADKTDHLNHVDIHFSFPIYSQAGKAFSRAFFPDFRNAVLDNPYLNLDDWGAMLDSENKQLLISVAEVEEWAKNFALKSYEGGSKILIVWNADRMREDASNKLLKFLEEPPEKTLIILTAADAQGFLPTILSRVQTVKIPRIEDADIKNYLAGNFDIDETRCREISYRAQGDLNAALKMVKSENGTEEFETLFVQWVRDAFKVAKKPEILKEIVLWARNIAVWNREKQRNFLDFCAEIFRQALLQNYTHGNLVYRKIDLQKFNWEGFSAYIHGANIESILDEISTADYHLQRNANPKIVWTDLGIKLSRYIHRK